MQAVELTITTGKVAFHVLRYGDGMLAAPLVLFHGFTGSAAMWQELAAEWSSRRTVFAVDLPYHGQTVCEAGLSWNEHLEALTQLVRQLSDRPVHLLGYSMGARLALGLAVTGEVPLASLTLESVHPGLQSDSERDERRRQDQRWCDLLLAEGIDGFATAWEELPLWQTQEPGVHRVRLHKSIRRTQRPGLLAESLHNIGLAAQPFLGGKLPALPFPVHLIAGGQDAKFSRISTEIRHLLPRGRMSHFQHCGHSVNIESPAEYAAVTAHFFHQSEFAGGPPASGANDSSPFL